MFELIGTIAAVYVGLILVLYGCQRQLLYHPGGADVSPAEAGVPQMSEVTLTTEDGLSLLAWYAPPRQARPGYVIAYFHGNAGHLANRAGKVAPYMMSGYGVLLTAYRGYSGNPGKPEEQGLYADGRAALAFLRQQGVAPDRIVLYGESLGSGVAVQMAGETDVAAMVLEAPLTSVGAVAQEHYPWAPASLLVRDRFDSLSKIGAIATPLMVVHGEEDRIIPVHHGREMLAAAAGPKVGRFVPRAGHNDLYDFGVANDVLEFLADALPKGRE